MKGGGSGLRCLPLVRFPMGAAVTCARLHPSASLFRVTPAFGPSMSNGAFSASPRHVSARPDPKRVEPTHGGPASLAWCQFSLAETEGFGDPVAKRPSGAKRQNVPYYQFARKPTTHPIQRCVNYCVTQHTHNKPRSGAAAHHLTLAADHHPRPSPTPVSSASSPTGDTCSLVAGA